MYADVLNIENQAMKIAQQHSLFDEHFSHQAILPGAFSITACLDGILKTINDKRRNGFLLKKIEKVNFLMPIGPGMALTLQIKKIIPTNQDRRVLFSLEDDNGQCYVKGSLLLGEAL